MIASPYKNEYGEFLISCHFLFARHNRKFSLLGKAGDFVYF